MDLLSDIKYQFRNGNVLMKLMLVNISAYLIQSILLLIFFLAGQRDAYLSFLTHWFWVSSDLHILITRPWTLFTHMFLHDPYDIFHILSNMIFLYFFGRILVDYLKPVYSLPLYLTGGLAGALVSIASFNLIPSLSENAGVSMAGASAAVMAIVLATATLAPNYTVFMILIGPVKIKYIAAFVILIYMISIPAESNIGGHLAHLGGALTGYLYIRAYRNGHNWFGWWPRFEEWLSGIFQRRRTKVAYVNPAAGLPKSKFQRTDAEIENQKQLDAILDKIKASGYDSLSRSEKEFLFKISNNK